MGSWCKLTLTLLAVVVVDGFLAPNHLGKPTTRSPFVPSPAGYRSSTLCRTESRLFARITQKQNQQEEDNEQGLPKVLSGDESELPKLTRQQEEAVDLSMGVIPPEEETLTEDEWTAQVEKRLQEMYEKGAYDPTPINLSSQELAKQQWMDEFLNKEERPIRWDLEYWFGTWLRPDIKFSSAGRGLKSFGFAVVGIGLVTLIFLIEDEVISPIFDDYQRWDGTDIFHAGQDLSAWLASIPPRVQNYVTHFSWQEYSSRVFAKVSSSPRWYQQITGLPGTDGP